jgi:hypothetical protein
MCRKIDQAVKWLVVLANRNEICKRRENQCECIPVYSNSASTFRDVRSHKSVHPGLTRQATNRRNTRKKRRKKKKKKL